MRIALGDGTPLRGDFVLRAVQRFDLTPIPSTLELVVRVDDSIGGRLAQGSTVVAGAAGERYTVLKIRRATTELNQGEGGLAEALEVTAALESVAALARPLDRAVIKEGRTLGEVYRACGSRARVTADIPVPLFSAFAGQFPTVPIAMVMQEEAAAPILRPNGALSFTRYADLFAGDPVESVRRDTTRAVQSDFLEQHEIPWALSTGADGGVVLGRRDLARGFVFLPRTAPRVLDNMSRSLVVRRTMVGSFAGHLRAGDGLDIAGVRHVVVTAAHAWDAGASGAGPDQTSRLWLAELRR